MNAYTYFREFIDKLKSIYSNGEANAITSIVFEKITSLKKTDLITSRDLELSELQIIKLNEALQDLLLHKPVQYVTGEARFFKLTFKVNPSVLIPRPETEELVSMVINHSKNNSVKRIIDIGSGSGCIPISIKKNIPEIDVVAIDISEEALLTASKNAIENKVEISFIEVDFLDEQKWNGFEKFDVIVSNPPYIPFSEKSIIPENVKEYEPQLALFVEEALIFYKKIAAFGKDHLNFEGKIFMEVHENFANQVLNHFIEEGYDGEIINDLSELQRFVIAKMR